MTDRTDGDSEGAEADPAPALPPPLPPPVPPPPEAMPPAAPEAGRARVLVAALVAGLVVILAGIATLPYWAPPLLPLLPWGERTTDHYRTLAQRVDRVEERLAARPAGPPAAPEAAFEAATASTHQALGALRQRLDRLAAAQDADRHALAPLPDLARRVAAIDPAALAKAEQDVTRLDGAIAALGTRLDSTTAALGARVDALSQRMDRAAAADNTDAALALALMELRDAVSRSQPFTAEYETFRNLAHARPALAAAAAPLAEDAAHGVAGDAALAQRLQALGGQIVGAQKAPKSPAQNPGWRSEILARVRGLVTIRHIGGAAETGAAAAVATAKQNLAQGDIAGAVAALGRLDGAQAAIARPWIEEARARLGVEATLRRLQRELTADLAAPTPANAAPAPATPPESPAPSAPPAASQKSPAAPSPATGPAPATSGPPS